MAAPFHAKVPRLKRFSQHAYWTNIRPRREQKLLMNEKQIGSVLYVDRFETDQVRCRTSALASLTNLQYNFAVVLPFEEQHITITRLLQRENFPNHRMQPPRRNPFRKLRPRRFHQRTIRAQIRQPQPMHARTLRIENARIERRSLTRRSTINNHAPELAHALDALRNVLPAQHFKNRVDSLAVRQLLNRLRIIAPLVINPMLQSQPVHLRQLFF